MRLTSSFAPVRYSRYGIRDSGFDLIVFKSDKALNYPKWNKNLKQQHFENS